MAVSPEALGHAPTQEVPTPVAIPGATLVPGEPVSLETRDNVGPPDFAALAEKERVKKGFATYRNAGGRFSEGLHRSLIARVGKLQKPGKRERSGFYTSTIAQAENYVFRHNSPLGPQGPLPPEQQISLSQQQIDAYCLLRENYVGISEKDRRDGAADPAQFSDVPLIMEIQKMPLLRPQEMQPQDLPVAA